VFLKRTVVLTSVVFFLSLATATCWGQAVGTLNGTVLDESGGTVPGAIVTAVKTDSQQESKTTTTSAGAYTLPYLPEGTYTIRVSMPGFETSTAENVVLRAAQTLTVNINMHVGQTTENVMVSATPPLLEAGTAEMGQYINQKEFKAWPIITSDGQRQIQQFIFSSLPGTTGDTFQGSINGGQQYSHEILIDGISLGRSDLSGGNNNEMSPSLDAIGDFKLQTGAVSAQYNGGQTAIANYSIKSGTNQLHGAAFDYLQNEAFNAVALGQNGLPAARYRDNNWGYAVGGPVIIPKIYNGRNRTFWFTNFEHDKRNQENVNGFTTLSPLAYRNGDFSQLLNPTYTSQSQAGTQVGTDALNRPVVFGAIYDPRTTANGPKGSVVRNIFPGNIIPSSRIDPVATNILKVGLVNPTYDTMIRNTPQLSSGQPFFDEHIFAIKVDQIITEKHRASFYFNYGYRQRNNTSTGNAYLPVPGPPTTGWQDQLTPSQMARFNLTSTITPTFVNNFSIGYNRFLNQNGAPLYTVNQDWASQIGIQNTSPTAFPTFNFSGLDWQGGTLAKIGVGSYGASANGSEVLKDEMTKAYGRHTFHFGYQYTRYFYNEQNYSGSGTFNFSPNQTGLPGFTTETGNSFASFMLGAVNSASNNIATLSDGFRGPYHALWLQDDIKVTPHLTVNVGFRWEIITPFFERTDRMSYIDLSQPDPAADNLPGVITFKNRPTNTYWGEIGPRLGIAYQVNDHMVARVGYAMMNTPPTANNWGYGGFTTGYNANITVPAGSSSTGFALDPSMYLSQPFPGLGYTLPDTNPADAHFNATQTVSPDANRPGYVQNYNISLQFLLPKQTVLETAYVGNHGTRLWGFGQLNVVPATNLSLGDTLLDPVSSHPQYKPYSSFPTDNTVAQGMLPYPQYYSVNDYYAYNTSSNYNALQITVTKHLTTNFGFLAAYTWSKTMGYQDNNGGSTAGAMPQDFFNRKLEYSLASFNQPHNFKLTWNYEIPVGAGRRWDLHWANFIVGGWQISGIHNYASGFPVTVDYGAYNLPAGFGSIRPDLVSGVPMTMGSLSSLKIDFSDPAQWLNPAAFAVQPLSGNGVPLRVGNAPRNLNLRGPLQISETVRASKAFALFHEKASFKFGMTMTNPFKRTFAYFADTTVGDSAFGQILQGGASRTMQLDARIDF
jgi:hypothetical protein